MKLWRLRLVLAALLGLGIAVTLAKPPPGSASAARSGPVTNSMVLRTNLTWSGRLSPGVALGCPPSGQAIAPPGVYVSEPYKCIVVVPETHLDERCLIAGGSPTVPMPTCKPELRLVPLGK